VLFNSQTQIIRRGSQASMDDKNYLFAIRHRDGGVTLYVDEAYAQERGADLSKLVRVEIPKDLYTSGTVQQIREYVASYLESQETGSAHA
jgi:hypothetical protein